MFFLKKQLLKEGLLDFTHKLHQFILNVTKISKDFHKSTSSKSDIKNISESTHVWFFQYKVTLFDPGKSKQIVNYLKIICQQ